MSTEAEIRDAGRQVFINRQIDRIASERLPRPDIGMVRQAMRSSPATFIADPQTNEITGDAARRIREAAGVPEREGPAGLPYRVYRRITRDGDTDRTVTIIAIQPADVRGAALPASVQIEESVTRAGTYIGSTMARSTFRDNGSDILIRVRDENNPRGNQTRIRLEPTQLRITTVSDGVETPPFTISNERIMEEGRRRLGARSEGPRAGIEVASVDIEQLGNVDLSSPLSANSTGQTRGVSRNG